MDIEKINDFVNVYSGVLQLDDELRQNIQELIQNLVKKYSDTLNIDPDINIADSVLVAALKSNIVDEVFD